MSKPKTQKPKFPTPTAPRPMEDLSRLYTQLVTQLGECEVNLRRLKAQCDRIIADIETLEIEGKASQALAAEVAKQAAVTTENANETV